MTLPRHPNLAWTLSFWFAADALLAAALALPIALLVSPAWSLSVLVAAAAVAAVGLFRPALAERPYRAWNALAMRYADIAREVVLRVCYFVVLASTARTGSRFEAARPRNGCSSWERKRAPGIENYDRRTAGPVSTRWVARYLAWSRRSGNLWADCLLPFVFLLMMLEKNDEEGPSTKLYTLY
jgi:hypothetical protein